MKPEQKHATTKTKTKASSRSSSHGLSEVQTRRLVNKLSATKTTTSLPMNDPAAPAPAGVGDGDGDRAPPAAAAGPSTTTLKNEPNLKQKVNKLRTRPSIQKYPLRTSTYSHNNVRGWTTTGRPRTPSASFALQLSRRLAREKTPASAAGLQTLGLNSATYKAITRTLKILDDKSAASSIVPAIYNSTVKFNHKSSSSSSTPRPEIQQVQGSARSSRPRPVVENQVVMPANESPAQPGNNGDNAGTQQQPLESPSSRAIRKMEIAKANYLKKAVEGSSNSRLAKRKVVKAKGIQAAKLVKDAHKHKPTTQTKNKKKEEMPKVESNSSSKNPKERKPKQLTPFSIVRKKNPTPPNVLK